MSMSLIKKIAAKSVFGSKEAIRKALPKDDKGEYTGEEVKLYSVAGIARGVKQGESNFGNWEGLTGDFIATNAQTGEMFRGPECFLPEIAHGMVASALLSADTNSVEFGFMVSAKPSDTAIGYEYIASPLIEADSYDPLEQLALKAGLALPAKAVPQITEVPGAENGEEKPASKKGK